MTPAQRHARKVNQVPRTLYESVMENRAMAPAGLRWLPSGELNETDLRVWSLIRTVAGAGKSARSQTLRQMIESAAITDYIWENRAEQTGGLREWYFGDEDQATAESMGTHLIKCGVTKDIVESMIKP